MKRTAIYCRVSTEEQSRHGLSIAMQEESLVKYAKEHHYHIVGKYIDSGYSARKQYKKRPELLRLLQDVQDDKIDLIIFIKLDRWFRDVKSYYEVQSILDEHNVAWQATLEDYETLSAGGRFKVNIMLAVAQDEADRTSERIKFVFNGKRERGETTNGSCPIGYKIEDKKTCIDDETKGIAIKMFDTYINTRSINETTRWMNSIGIKRSSVGVHNMLSNRHYIGSDGYPPLIDTKTFQRTQEIMQTRSPRHTNTSTHDYLFAGLVFCGVCGHRMKASSQKDKRKYYSCRYHTDYGNTQCINGKCYRENVIEQFLLDNLVETIKQKNLELTETIPPKVDVDKIKKKMEKLKNLFLEDLIDKNIYEQDYRTLEAELEKSYEEPPQPIKVEYVIEYLKLYRASNIKQKSGFWSKVIKRIMVDGNGNISFIPN